MASETDGMHQVPNTESRVTGLVDGTPAGWIVGERAELEQVQCVNGGEFAAVAMHHCQSPP